MIFLSVVRHCIRKVSGQTLPTF